MPALSPGPRTVQPEPFDDGFRPAAACLGSLASAYYHTGDELTQAYQRSRSSRVNAETTTSGERYRASSREIARGRVAIRREPIRESPPTSVLQKYCKRLLHCAAAVSLLGGLAAMSWAAVDLKRFSSASQAFCRIQGFHARERIHRTICLDNETSCTFTVAVQNADYGAFLVRSWAPGFKTDKSGDVEVADDAFQCCPTVPFNCCRFFHDNISQFCDNWVDVHSSCPSAPWLCYVFNLKARLDAGEVPPEDLHVGNILQSVPLLLAGLVCFLLGSGWFASLNARVRKQYKLVCERARVAFISVVPAHRRTRRMKDLFEAAVIIQSCARVWVVRCAIEKQRKERRRYWVFDDFREEAARQHLEFSKPIIGPPPAGVKSQDLLLDTGDINTFRKLVPACVRGMPGKPFEYIEVAVTNASKEEIGLTMFLNGEGKPTIADVRKGSISATYGLRKGHVLLKAGRFQWPHATGKQLLAMLHGSHRPLFLVFQGLAGVPVCPPPKDLMKTPLPPPSPPPPLDLHRHSDGTQGGNGEGINQRQTVHGPRRSAQASSWTSKDPAPNNSCPVPLGHGSVISRPQAAASEETSMSTDEFRTAQTMRRRPQSAPARRPTGRESKKSSEISTWSTAPDKSCPVPLGHGSVISRPQAAASEETPMSRDEFRTARTMRRRPQSAPAHRPTGRESKKNSDISTWSRHSELRSSSSSLQSDLDMGASAQSQADKYAPHQMSLKDTQAVRKRPRSASQSEMSEGPACLNTPQSYPLKSISNLDTALAHSQGMDPVELPMQHSKRKPRPRSAPVRCHSEKATQSPRDQASTKVIDRFAVSSMSASGSCNPTKLADGIEVCQLRAAAAVTKPS